MAFVSQPGVARAAGSTPAAAHTAPVDAAASKPRPLLGSLSLAVPGFLRGLSTSLLGASSAAPAPPRASAAAAEPAAPAREEKPRPLKWKDCNGIVPVCRFRGREELERALLRDGLAPRDNGTLSLIVLRPTVGRRYVIGETRASRQFGVHGSGWVEDPFKKLLDQVCVMPTHVIREVAIAGDTDSWAPAGDQLFMDFDMSDGNIAPGDRVRVGDDVVLEMTTKPHLGCMKFIARYGMDAMTVLNSREGRKRKLRGIYFMVVTDGMLRTGDRIVKVARDAV